MVLTILDTWKTQKIKCYFFFLNKCRYIVSTLSLAQGVLRKKTKLDLIEGSCLKQLILTFKAMCSHP